MVGISLLGFTLYYALSYDLGTSLSIFIHLDVVFNHCA